MEIIKEYTAEFNMFGDTEKSLSQNIRMENFIFIMDGWKITNRAQSLLVDMTAWMKRKNVDETSSDSKKNLRRKIL